MSEFKSWEEMSELEQLSAEYSDYHKSAYGFRPRGIDTSTWTVQDFHNVFQGLAQQCQHNEAQRIAQESAAAIVVESRIATMIAEGAGDRATAIRWLHQAEGSDGDVGYLCFLLGVDYNYFSN